MALLRLLSSRKSSALLCALIVFQLSGAAAQNFFEQLFGGMFENRAHAPRVVERPRLHRLRTAHPFAHRSSGRATALSPSQARDPNVFFESAGNGRSYCVRECDGYFFPVGIYSSASDSASHQQSCNKLCPGARTALYVMRSGSDKIEDAVAARGGASYAKLTAALTRRGEANKPCSCHSTDRAEQPTNAIYRDFTLRRGDAVMTPHGMEVFHGGARYPYAPSDFRALAESRDLPQRTRRMLAALERTNKPGAHANERRAKLLDEHRSQAGGGGR